MRLTNAQLDVLSMCTDGPNLRNGDEYVPQWWIEGSGGVNKRTAEFLVRNKLVELSARWGGHPGILGYRITPAGRSALSKETGDSGLKADNAAQCYPSIQEDGSQ